MVGGIYMGNQTASSQWFRAVFSWCRQMRSTFLTLILWVFKTIDAGQVATENMCKICWFFRENTNILWFSNMANTFLLRNSRSEVSLLCPCCAFIVPLLCPCCVFIVLYAGADWLDRQTPTTWGLGAILISISLLINKMFLAKDNLQKLFFRFPRFVGEKLGHRISNNKRFRFP